jgi:hypothetical protein
MPPTFTAKEKGADGIKEPLYAPTDTEMKPGEEVSSASVDGLRFLGDAKFYVYTTDDLESDVLRPDYFGKIMLKNSNSYFGALILYTATNGEKDAAQWRTGILRVVQVSGGRGVPAEAPTLCAVVARFGEATAGSAVN